RLRVDQEAGIVDPTNTAGRRLPDGLRLSAPVSLSMSPGMQAVFGDIHPNWLWQSVNAGADFSWSGQAMSQMYQQATGGSVNGAAAGGHLRLWSADTPEEVTLEQTGLAGDPAAQLPDRTFHLAVENRNATKMDYYVQVKVRQEVHLTKLGTAVVRTAVTVDD